MCFWPRINIIENSLKVCKHFWTIHQNLSHPIVIHATNEIEKNQALAGKGKVKDEFPRLRLMRLFFTSLSSQFLYLVLYCQFDIGVSSFAFISKIGFYSHLAVFWGQFLESFCTINTSIIHMYYTYHNTGNHWFIRQKCFLFIFKKKIVFFWLPVIQKLVIKY